eukprot:7370-Eustigmatos_ZCMA.PRE.1
MRELHARKLDCDICGACAGASALWRARLARDAAVAEHAADVGARAGDDRDPRGGSHFRRDAALAIVGAFTAGAGGGGIYARALVSRAVVCVLHAAVAGCA